MHRQRSVLGCERQIGATRDVDDEAHRPRLAAPCWIGTDCPHAPAGGLDPNVAGDCLRVVLGARVHLDARGHGDAVPIPPDDVDAAVHPGIYRERSTAHGTLESRLANLAMLDAGVAPRVMVAIV